MSTTIPSSAPSVDVEAILAHLVQTMHELHLNQLTSLLLYIFRTERETAFACDCDQPDHTYAVRDPPLPISAYLTLRQACSGRHPDTQALAKRYISTSGWLDNVCNSCLMVDLYKPFPLVVDIGSPHPLDTVHGKSTSCRYDALQLYGRAVGLLSSTIFCKLVSAPAPNEDGSINVDTAVEWLRTPYRLNTLHRGMFYYMHLCVVIEFFTRPTTTFTPSCNSVNLERFVTPKGTHSYRLKPDILRLDGVSPGSSYSYAYMDTVRPHCENTPMCQISLKWTKQPTSLVSQGTALIQQAHPAGQTTDNRGPYQRN
jgi:hypothetical protein